MDNQALKDVVLALIKPSTQAALRHLLKSEDWSQSQTDAASAAKTFAGTFQKDLVKLTKYKILEINKVGREVYYRIDREKAVQLLDLVCKIEEV